MEEGGVMGRRDVYLQPHAPDPVLSEQTVLELARSHVGRAEAVTAIDESGGEARVYVVDEAVVVKTQRPPRLRPRTSLAKEAALLRQLAGPLEAKVPALFGHGRVQAPEGMVEYLCMSRVSGRAVAQGSGRPPRAVLHQLGEVLRSLHRIEMPGEAELIPADTGPADLRKRLEGAFDDVLAGLVAVPTAVTLPLPPDRIADRALRALPTGLGAPMVVLHSNPGPTHTFVGEDGRFTGLIDFGDAYRSHSALDLVRWPRADDRLALREGYLRDSQVDAEFEAVWTVAMVHADLAVLCNQRHSPPGAVTAEAADDLLVRLAQV